MSSRGPGHHRASSKCEAAEPITGLPFYFEMKVEALLLFCLPFHSETPQMLWEDCRSKPEEKGGELIKGNCLQEGLCPAPLLSKFI